MALQGDKEEPGIANLIKDLKRARACDVCSLTFQPAAGERSLLLLLLLLLEHEWDAALLSQWWHCVRTVRLTTEPWRCKEEVKTRKITAKLALRKYVEIKCQHVTVVKCCWKLTVLQIMDPWDRCKCFYFGCGAQAVSLLCRTASSALNHLLY